MTESYRNIQFTSRIADRSLLAFASELVETRLADPHPAFAPREVEAAGVEDVLDGEQQLHRLTDLFRAGVAVAHLLIELAEIELAGNPHADRRVMRRVDIVGHGPSANLQGLTTTGGATA